MSGPQYPHDQSIYQVRLGAGSDGLARLAPADVVVLVDVLGASGAALAELLGPAARPAHDPETAIPAPDAATPVPETPTPAAPTVLVGALRNAAAVADAVLEVQRRRGRRTSVSLAVGADAGAPGVPDQLAAGAIIAALADRGVDHCSPETAVAGEAFRALRGAARHLFTASGAGRAAGAQHGPAVVAAAAVLDDTALVPVLTPAGWRPFA